MSKKPSLAIAASISLFLAFARPVAASGGQPKPTTTPAAPPAPVLASPATGASLVQPISLNWSAPPSTTGAIGSYTWQVGTTSAFTNIIASGFTNQEADATIPVRLFDKVSGLPNGTYFWRVKASEASANGGVDTTWSAIRTFTVTALGPAPATPTITGPANNAQFHLVESFKIQWTAVQGAHSYILEADDEPTFSYPLNLMLAPLNFGTGSGAIWGNALTAYYRVRAVSVDGVRSLPSAPIAVKITDLAPVPPAPAQLAPATGASVALPFFVDWSDSPNPQVPGYELEFSTDTTFSATSVALGLTPTRSDYMITRDLLAPGSYFWHVRSAQGNGASAWSPARAITVTAGPTPPNVNLFAIIAEPINGYGGNSVQARLMLDNPAPAGGAVVSLSTDLPPAQMPSVTITIPAGQTDALITPIATGPVPNNGGGSIGILGDLFAGFGNGRAQSSLGVLPIFFGTALTNESIVGGNPVIGTVTLQVPAPPGGVTVRLISSDTNLARPPATIFLPAGATDADFTVTTSAVSVPTRVVIETGTDIDGYRAPQTWLTLTPAGNAPPAASLSNLTLSQTAIPAGKTVTGTVTLTSPAPAGGAVVTLNASDNGQVITPPSVTIPAGSLSATFPTLPAPQTSATHWVFFQAHFGTSGGSRSRVLEVDPASGTPTLLAIGPSDQDVIGGNQARGSVALIMPAPAGGAVVNLMTDNPTYISVPASVSISQGNSAVSFTIGTNPVSTLPTGGNVTASAGGVTKSIFVTIHPDPNAPPILQSVAINPSTVTGGTSATGTVFLNSPAPSGGITATLSTSNTTATPPGVVTIPAGQTSANFPVTTRSVTTNTVVSIQAIVGSASQSASMTVTPNIAPPPPTPTPAPTGLAAPSQLSPAADARFTPGTNIGFDWSDVSGAASYTIQIDDADTFLSPFIVSQTVSTSQFSSSTLPTKTMWWRVRANDASGKASNWSAARRFEVKS